MKKLILISLFCVNLFCLIGYAGELKGAGSGVVGPLLTGWNNNYVAGQGVLKIVYTPSSSGDGVARIKANTVDFGQTDAPITLPDLRKNDLFQFPSVMLAFTPVVNLYDARITSGSLKLDGQVLGDIFMGKITQWDDPAIISLNPGLDLPNKSIHVIYRSGSTGSTYSISSYISLFNAEWNSKYGAEMNIPFPIGQNTKSIDETVKSIQNTPYSISYLELSNAISNHIQYVKLKNKSGNFVPPSPDGVLAAAKSVEWDYEKGFIVSFGNARSEVSWPMAAVSYTVIRKTVDDVAHARELINFFVRGLRIGELAAIQSGAIPLNPETYLIVKDALYANIFDKNGVRVFKEKNPSSSSSSIIVSQRK